MTDWLRPLLLMFYAPTRAMAEARDRAPLGLAIGLFVAASLLMWRFWSRLPAARSAD